MSGHVARFVGMITSQRVLVTGAGTGIGALTAASLAAAGHRVFASVRDPDGRSAKQAQSLLERSAGAPGELSVVKLDVADQGSCDRAVAGIVEAADGLDVVVNNAGHLAWGITEAFTAEQFQELYDVNCVGAHRVNRAALPVLRAQRAGLLVWNGSGTTRAIPPYLGPYTAAKAAFDALAEATAWDVAALGIETTIVHPGVFTTGTNHFPDADQAADTERAEAYRGTVVAAHLDSMLQDTERLFPDGRSADPQIVADEITRVVNLPPGTRPRRTVADGSDYGAEIINGAAEELRLRLARRMGVTDLLGPRPS